jgi:VWFA-related protein
MKLRTVLLLLLACQLLSVISLYAQQPSPAEQPAATVSTTTELVLVPVQVKGSDGKPRLNLKQEDFILKSDGKPQTISVFEESQAAAPRPASPTPPAKPNQQIYSSVPDGGMPQQLLIIAIDLVNTPFLEQGRARQQLLKYLSQDLPSQPFALVAITKYGLRQIHSFSSDPAALAAALRRMEVSPTKEEMQDVTLDTLGSGDQTQLQQAFQESEIYGAYAAKIAAEATLAGLSQIAQAYAGVPGRKSVIWLTGGLPMLLTDPIAGGVTGSLNGVDTDLVDRFQDTFSALNTANIAIYSVNLNGLSTGTPNYARGNSYGGNNRGATLGASQNINGTYRGMGHPLADDPTEGIKLLANKTGGKWCTAMTELKTCIDQAVQDSTSYYLLGFYVPQHDRKPGWHKVEVKLASGRDAVRSRPNYYLAPQTAPTTKQIGTMIRDAAVARIGYTGLAFTVERLPDDAAGAATAKLRVHVPATSVLTPPAAQKTLAYDIAVVPLTATGDVINNIKFTHLNFSPEQTENSLSHGWSVNEPSPPLASTAAVKYIIRDTGTGRIGSVIVPLNTTKK